MPDVERPDPTLTEAEVRQILRIDRRALNRLVSDGRLTPIMEGRNRRFRASEVEYLIRR